VASKFQLLLRDVSKLADGAELTKVVGVRGNCDAHNPFGNPDYCSNKA
jgi:hypothetical protein